MVLYVVKSSLNLSSICFGLLACCSRHMLATACRAEGDFAMIGTANCGWHGYHATQYLWLFNRRQLNTFIEYSYIEYYTHTMSNVTASGNIWVPTQPLVEAFSDATHEAFHEYLRSKPDRFRFTDEAFLFKRRIIQEKHPGPSGLASCSYISAKHPQYCRNTSKRTRNAEQRY